jgi:hypothetical protein
MWENCNGKQKIVMGSARAISLANSRARGEILYLFSNYLAGKGLSLAEKV